MSDNDGFIDFSKVIPTNPINLGRFIFEKPPVPVTKKKEEIEKTIEKPPTRKQKFTLNLIKLYEQHECLWNPKDKDFLNLPLKNHIWEDIAKTLKHEGEVDYIKRYMHTLRYKVNLQKVQQLEAILHQNCSAPEKLYYTDQLKFLNQALHDGFEKKDESRLSQQVAKNSHSLVNNSKSTLKPIDSTVSERLRIYKSLRNSKNTERNCLKYEIYKRLNPAFAKKLKRTEVKEQLQLQQQQQQLQQYNDDDDYNDTFPIDCNFSECGTSSWNSFVRSVPESMTKLQSIEESKIVEPKNN